MNFPELFVPRRPGLINRMAAGNDIVFRTARQPGGMNSRGVTFRIFLGGARGLINQRVHCQCAAPRGFAKACDAIRILIRYLPNTRRKSRRLNNWPIEVFGK